MLWSYWKMWEISLKRPVPGLQKGAISVIPTITGASEEMPRYASWIAATTIRRDLCDYNKQMQLDCEAYYIPSLVATSQSLLNVSEIASFKPSQFLFSNRLSCLIKAQLHVINLKKHHQ